jgi:hypothetical protein
MLVDGLPPIRASIRVLLDPEIHGLSSKMKIIMVMFFVQYVQVWEILRLKFGGKSKR